MSYASVMVHVEPGAASDARVRIAGDVADRFGASLIGLAGGALRPSHIPDGQMVPSEIEAEINRSAGALADLERHFLQVANAPGRQLEWRACAEFPADALTVNARAADMVVIGKTGAPGEPWQATDPTAVLLKAGRPVLLVPPNVQTLSAKKVLIAWQDSREARRAVHDALPMLEKADEILLTHVCEQGDADAAKESVQDIKRYLSRHRIGVSAGVMMLAGGSVTEELLRLAGSERIDLIVAGACGHNRLGEWIFGGVTRTLLAQTPICCLFSH